MSLTNDYESFCFDEACVFIIRQLEDKVEPKFEDEADNNNDNIIDFFNENNQNIR